MRRILFTAVIAGAAVVSSAAVAGNTPIPKAAQGVWAEGGKCGGATVTFTARTLQYKGQQAQAAYFSPGDSPRGYGAIHYVQEGNVDNFEFAKDKGLLIYNPEGYGMGKSVIYKRCR
ncbi:hypothetical protein [Labrys sp. ZIDIC5]|uniref:hypothetical protein n=1 Tax=Labrys sedimenti TaxID=3106036 RepID=UPI002ACA35EA|nr:hypothetical protein [Labrys sp. ZIDIC5]MDZ5454671.1 hypothetical protein [Labrys sp. ZIDIC5]